MWTASWIAPALLAAAIAALPNQRRTRTYLYIFVRRVVRFALRVPSTATASTQTEDLDALLSDDAEEEMPPPAPL